ncbi:MAG: ribosome-associated translation inhibitor RaiA [Deltaproteobacteria bacterium]|jgi:putative sigma-54 modulation protein|nr:ribosome-associated translation inhibitor RaiA [Deltaproteobacteria bacterium]
MQYTVTFRRMEPSEHLKEFGREKMARLEKYLDSVIDVDLTFTVEKFRHRVEAVVTADGLKIKAEEQTEDMYSALDLVVDKLEKQIKRHREKLKLHNKGQNLAKRPSSNNGGHEGYDDSEPPEDEPFVTDRVRDLPLAPLSLEEAAAKLALSNAPFVVFLDQDNGGVRLLHKMSAGSTELVRYHPENNS